MEQNEIEFGEVWLSSIEHLNEFNRISKNYKWWKNLLGINQHQNNFPTVTSMGLFRFPIIFYAYGRLIITNDKLYFESKSPIESKNIKYKNVERNIKFEYDFSDIENIELFNINYTKDERFNYPWVSVKLKNHTNFLIANVKKAGEIEIGINNTEQIYKYLKIRLYNTKFN